jgi:signal peptide peptidase SppA
MMHRIAARVFDTPHFVDAGKAAAMALGLGRRLLGEDVTVTGAAPVDHWLAPRAGVVGDRLERAYAARGEVPAPIVDGVAIIAVEGTLVSKGAWIGQASGETSYEGLMAQVELARRSPGVRGVAFEIDSYGGEASSLIFSLAERMRRLSAEKPTIAILTDHALSAGYLLASQARQIVLPKHGAAGSIGVVTMHVDRSREIEQAGLVVTVIQSGAHKTDGSSLRALPEDLRDRIQARVDALRDDFAEAVAAGRGRRTTKLAALATEARIFEGAEAVAAGLADAVGDPHEAFAAFRAAVNRN